MKMTISKNHRNWWDNDEGRVGDSVMACVEYLDTMQNYRTAANLQYVSTYSSSLTQSLRGSDYARALPNNRLRMNIIASVIDTICAKMATVKPRPLPLTTRGNWEMQQKAKNLGNFLDGLFYWTKHYNKQGTVLRDAGIFGDGFLKVYPFQGEVVTERIFPNEILVDDLEAKFAEPRQMFQHKQFSKDDLASYYPDKAQMIQDSSVVRLTSAYNVYDSLIDPVSCVEAWYLPSRKGASDGRHVITVSRGVLVDEPWEFTTFPFAHIRWRDDALGYFGLSACKNLFSIQMEMNYMLEKIQRIMTLFTTQIWGPKQNFSKNQLSNQDGVYYEYNVAPPTVLTPQMVSAETYAHLDRLWQRAYDLEGVSELSASGRKPPGLNSGAALRVQQDVESQRMAELQRKIEQFALDTASLMINAARQIDEEEGGYKIISPGNKDLEELNFSEVDLEDDKFVLNLYPTNFLPATPAGKLETIKDMAEISPEISSQLFSLLSFPDLERAQDLVNAPLDLADKSINEILSHGRMIRPNIYMDLNLTIQRAHRALLRAEIENAPDERINLLRLFIQQCGDLLSTAQEQEAAAQAPLPAPPVPPPEMQLPPEMQMPPEMAMPQQLPPEVQQQPLM